MALITVAIVGGHAIVASLFHDGHFDHYVHLARMNAAKTSTSLPRPTVTARIVPKRAAAYRTIRKARRNPAARRHAAQVASPRAASGIVVAIGGPAAPTRSSGFVSLPLPSFGRVVPAPVISPVEETAITSGPVRLLSYSITPVRARPGQTVMVRYVADNVTGTIFRLLLGASIKAAETVNWRLGAIGDRADDLVATIPPGRTMHWRYFHLPAGLRPGSYDTAWGLLDPRTRRRVALVGMRRVLSVSP